MQESAQTDERFLIRRAAQGDPEAFRGLYDAHVDRVYRLAFRMTGDEDMAMECTQDAFVKAFRGLPDFRQESRFSTWMHSITVSVTLNGLRSRKRRGQRETDLSDQMAGSGHGGPGDPSLRDRIRRAVNGLPEIYRTVFLMHDLEGYPHHEIAESLSIAVGTSKARLSRAREKLRHALGDVIEEYVS